MMQNAERMQKSQVTSFGNNEFSLLVIEKGNIIDFGTPEYIIPKYDHKEFMAEL